MLLHNRLSIFVCRQSGENQPIAPLKPARDYEPTYKLCSSHPIRDHEAWNTFKLTAIGSDQHGAMAARLGRD
jgi:hypothetical protein